MKFLLLKLSSPWKTSQKCNGSFGNAGTEKMSNDIERHLRRYFDLHGNILPPVGLYNRILKELRNSLDSCIFRSDRW